jgi:hypothetical protein
MKIHKQTLTRIGPNILELPTDTDFLKVGFQNDELCVWYSFSSENIRRYTLEVIATGQEFEPIAKQYLGSAISDRLVWHVYNWV